MWKSLDLFVVSKMETVNLRIIKSIFRLYYNDNEYFIYIGITIWSVYNLTIQFVNDHVMFSKKLECYRF